MKTEPTKGILDEHDRNARLKPALLTILPASLLVTGQGVGFSAAMGVFVGSLSAIGFTWVLAQFARDWGLRKQSCLYTLWDGKPTIALLRHRNVVLNPHTRARYHEALGRIIGKTFPTAAEEQAAPDAADAIYDSAGDLLREKTRDKKEFPLVFKELVNYGFRRNLWGMKSFGIGLASVCIMLQLAVATREIVTKHPVAPTLLLTTLANVLLLFGWLFIVSPSWVRIPADAYAERLLAACTAIDTTHPKKQVSRKKES
jgi:hypothetical protein